MHRHTKYSKIKNPVKADKKSIAKGKEVYESRCMG
jgi:hypothetical protein